MLLPAHTNRYRASGAPWVPIVAQGAPCEPFSDSHEVPTTPVVTRKVLTATCETRPTAVGGERQNPAAVRLRGFVRENYQMTVTPVAWGPFWP